MQPRNRTLLFVLPVAGCLFALLAWQLVRSRLHSTEDGSAPVRPVVVAGAQPDAQGVLIRFEVRADGPMDDSSLQGAALVGLVLARPDGTLVPSGEQVFQPSLSGGVVTLRLPPQPQEVHALQVAGQLAIKNSQGEELERLPLPTVIRW